jgi:hypothetical protein
MKPITTTKQNEWLSNFDIMDVMAQYEKIYDNFVFLGAVPIDFQELGLFSQFKLNNLIKDKKEIIGIIFNTDESSSGGSHWISLVVNIPNQTICFFDSMGSSPPKQIDDFIKSIQKQSKKLKFDVFINKNKHQSGNSACGIYAIHFIIKQLQGTTCSELNDTLVSDRQMKKNFRVYFCSK